MSKKESEKSIIIFAIFLFSPIIIPPALIILFSYRDTNIVFAICYIGYIYRYYTKYKE